MIMHYRLLHPNDYVGAHDLDGQDRTVTIVKVEFEELVRVGGEKERKPVVWFKGAAKRLVLNKTNATTIAAIHGPQTDEWAGKQITLYPTTTKFGRETVECVRVRPKGHTSTGETK